MLPRWVRKLPVIERLVHYGEIFYQYVGAGIWLYIFLSLLATLTESLGIGLFFPLLNGLSGNSSIPKTSLEIRYTEMLSRVGLEYNLKTVLVSIVVVFLMKAVLIFLSGLYQSYVTATFMSSITKEIIATSSAQEYRKFLQRNIGVLANAMVNETNRAMVAFMKFASLFPPMIAILVFATFAVRIDYKATLFALFFGMVALLLLRNVARLARKYSRENTESFGDLNSLVYQALGAFKYLSSTHRFLPLRRQTETTVDRLVRTQYYLSGTSIFTQSLNEPVVILFLVTLLWQQIFFEGRQLSGVIVLALFFFRLIKEVMNLQGGWHAFSSTMGSIDLVYDVIRQAKASEEKYSGETFSGVRKSIRFENATFSYGNKAVLRGLTLEIPKNYMVAVVGESGSGKSTFVDLLTGLLKPDSGDVFSDEVSYRNLNLATLRDRIGYVTQEPALFNDTLANNISFWDSGDASEIRKKVDAAAAAANCTSFISGMAAGIDTMLGDRGVNLSGGQKQRVAIARELYKKPDLLILDEATSALDSEAELEIQKSIEGLRGKLTTVVIAHRLSTIRNADRIFVFSQGRLVEQGTFNELHDKAGSQFQKFCQLQGI